MDSPEWEAFDPKNTKQFRVRSSCTFNSLQVVCFWFVTFTEGIFLNSFNPELDFLPRFIILFINLYYKFIYQKNLLL